MNDSFAAKVSVISEKDREFHGKNRLFSLSYSFQDTADRGRLSFEGRRRGETRGFPYRLGIRHQNSVKNPIIP